MNRQIFRKVALEHVSSPDRLDELLEVTHPRSWLVLVATAALLTLAVVWLVAGRIPLTVTGHIILLPEGGVKSIIATQAGIVQGLSAEVGDQVEAGQIIATLQTAEGDSLQSIAAPVAGRIIEVASGIGAYVEQGQRVAALEAIDEHGRLEGVLYIPQRDSARLAPGMTVRIAPTTVKTAETGFLLGQVATVGSYPVTQASLLHTLGNSDLAAALVTEPAMVEVRVALVADSTTPSGYRWSAQGSENPLSSGILGTATIVTSYQKPLEMVIPVR